MAYDITVLYISFGNWQHILIIKNIFKSIKNNLLMNEKLISTNFKYHWYTLDKSSKRNKEIYINNNILINIHIIFPHFEFVIPLSWPHDIVSVQRVTNYLCFYWSNSFNFPMVSSHFQTPSLYEISMFSAMIFVNII